ncbi:MAG: DUF3987 domain-containing protein [Candidatus Anstonellaceae archaeon]
MLFPYEFPVEALPDGVNETLAKLHVENGIHAAYTSTAYLVAASAAIGSRVSLRISHDNFTMLNLFGMLVGKSGTGKSPAVAIAIKAIKAIDKEMQERNKQLIQAYNEAKKEKEKVAVPALEHIIMDDFTHESLLFELQHNRHGLLLHVDEYTTFEANLKRYSDGSPINHYLSIWDGNSVKVTRKTQMPIYIERPFLSFLTTNQPGRFLKSLASNQESGFFQRFLIANPDTEMRVTLSDAKLDISCLSDSLLGIYHSLPPMPEDGKPHIIKFTKQAFNLYKESIYNANLDIVGDDDYLLSAHAKMARAAARIAAILAIIENGGLCDVGGLYVEKAADIYDYYLRQHVFAADRQKTPLSSLPRKQLLIYKELPMQFTVKEAEFIARSNNLSFSTLLRVLNNRNIIRKSGKIFEKIYL